MSKIKKALIKSISVETSLSRDIVEKVLKAYEKKALKKVRVAKKGAYWSNVLDKIEITDPSVKDAIIKLVGAKKRRVGIFNKEMQKAAASVKMVKRKPTGKPTDEDTGPGFAPKRRGRI